MYQLNDLQGFKQLLYLYMEKLVFESTMDFMLQLVSNVRTCSCFSGTKSKDWKIESCTELGAGNLYFRLCDASFHNHRLHWVQVSLKFSLRVF